MIYMAEVESKKSENGQEKTDKGTYVALTDSMLKIRLAKHRQTFEEKQLKNATELSKHIWKLKEKHVNCSIKWKVVGKAPSYSNHTKRCRLCILEKFFILCKPKWASLNQRAGPVNSCRHCKKYKLNNNIYNVLIQYLN